MELFATLFDLIYKSTWFHCEKSSDGDPFISRKRILIHIFRRLDSILSFIKHFLSVYIDVSKTFVFFLRTASEYLTRYEQGSVFKIHFQGSV